VHTSTITVAVLPEPTTRELLVPDSELEILACRGSGPGGQHRNKISSAIQIKHLPTGIMVRSEGERSQFQNKAAALAVIRSRLWAAMQHREAGDLNSLRKSQLGSGMRGDKRRTIACQRGTVDDHVTGKSWQLNDYLNGNW
jgi:peptide chain release factor 1